MALHAALARVSPGTPLRDGIDHLTALFAIPRAGLVLLPLDWRWTAREREAEKIEALDLGADDYVNKPFNVGELMARVRTAMRHRMQRKAEVPVHGK